MPSWVSLAALLLRPLLTTLPGLPRDATPAAVKHAYRRLALQLHPDKAGLGGAEGAAASAAFQRVSFAYSVLSSAEKRRYYDATGDTEELEVSAEEFASSLQEMLGELLGGLSLQARPAARRPATSPQQRSRRLAEAGGGPVASGGETHAALPFSRAPLPARHLPAGAPASRPPACVT